MSILIRGMEMPKKKNGAVLIIYPDGKCAFEDGFHYKAVPVPKHGDLIGREWIIDIALHLMNAAKNDDIANGVKWLCQYIIEAPTIIPPSGGKEDE